MPKFMQKVADAALTAFMALSAVVAVLWLTRFSGIVWTTPLALVDSFWSVMLSLAKHWGPIFVPTAAVIFVFKMFEKNVAFEILTLLKPEVERHVSSTVGAAVNAVVVGTIEPRIRLHSLAAIRCLLRSLARKSLVTPGDILPMYDATKRDFDQLTSARAGEEPA